MYVFLKKNQKVHFELFKIHVDFFDEISRLDATILMRIIIKGIIKFELKFL
jgi:hypothetical protein